MQMVFYKKRRCIEGLAAFTIFAFFGLSALFSEAGQNLSAGCAVDMAPRTPEIESEITARINDEIMIAIIAQNVTDLDAYQVDIVYDANGLTFLKSLEETQDNQNLLKINGGETIYMPPKHIREGTVRIAGALLGNHTENVVSGGGVISLLKFKVLDETRKKDVCLANVLFPDSTGKGDYATSLENGTILPVDNSRPSLDFSFTEPDKDGPVSIQVKIDFSEPVAGFEKNDIRVSGGEIDTFAGSGKTYTFLLRPEIEGDIQITVPADSAHDDSGNGNLEKNAVYSFNPNHPPSIFGTPPTAVYANETYKFTPKAEDPDPEDSLLFNIENKPDWADFDIKTGVLNGIPLNSDIGEYENIRISVTDSNGDSIPLPAFQISVKAIENTDSHNHDKTETTASKPDDDNSGGVCFIESVQR